MKIKKFKNLWTMGLLLTGGILITFYILKLACPQFIVGVAELPAIVTLGTFVDSHKWAYFLYNVIIGSLGAYIYCGACCRKYKFKLYSYGVIVLANILLSTINLVYPNYYTAFNYLIFIITPFILCVLEKCVTSTTFISTVVCFSVDIVSQILSAEIRNLFILATHINSATMTILLIDTWIWRFLLLSFFNCRKE